MLSLLSYFEVNFTSTWATWGFLGYSKNNVTQVEVHWGIMSNFNLSFFLQITLTQTWGLNRYFELIPQVEFYDVSYVKIISISENSQFY
jgi:hypothetical protein